MEIFVYEEILSCIICMCFYKFEELSAVANQCSIPSVVQLKTGSMHVKVRYHSDIFNSCVFTPHIQVATVIRHTQT